MPVQPPPVSGAAAASRIDGVAPAACRHCGSPVPAESPRADFCCRGCEVVHSLLIEEGLTRFYDLAGGKAAPAEPPRGRSFAWLEPLVESAEASCGEACDGNEICSLSLDVQGIHCAACVWLMNEMFRRRPGGAGITVNPALGKMRLSWRRGRFDVAGYLGDIERFGYLFGPDRKRAGEASRELPIRMGICAAITINVMLFSTSFYLGLGPGLGTSDAPVFRLFSRLEVILSALVMIVGGKLFFASAWRALRRGVLHLDLPIAVGIVLAYGASFLQAAGGRGDKAYFDTLNVFVTLMLVGRWLQQRVVERNRRFLVEDDGADGISVRRVGGDRIETIRAPQVRAGDVLMVAPGDCVPVDALLADERGAFTTDWITGEPDVRHLAKGATIPAGAFNAGQQAVTVAARTAFQDSPLPLLLRAPSAPTSEAEAVRAVPAHARFFDLYARVYVAVIFVVAAGAALLWWKLDPSRAIDVTVAILVVTCPCAVGLAAPLAVELVQARLRRAGFFVKSPDLLDRLTRVRKLLFDKTGTLTLGRLALVGGDAPGSLDGAARDAAFDMVSRSNHPVSRCLAESLARAGARFQGDAVVTEEPGCGLSLERGGHLYRLGRPDWAVTTASASSIAPGTTVLSLDGAPLASFVTAEEVRPDARRELSRFREQGYEQWLISGDSQDRVTRFAADLGIPADHALGGQKPEDKAAAVKSIDQSDTLYLGDGVNDSLAFGSALCAGTTAIDRPVLPGRADFFLLGDGVGAIQTALQGAQQLRGILRRNLIFAIVYNLIAVIACLAGVMTPLRAALAMPASSLTLLYLTNRSLGPRRSSVNRSGAPEFKAPPRAREAV